MIARHGDGTGRPTFHRHKHVFQSIAIEVHDVLAQDSSADSADPYYLIYDGQGSMRQLALPDGTLVNGQTHYYDAYGRLRAWSATPLTNLRYTGEMFDSNLGHYYNRARWYNPANGRFNRMDPFAGNNQDPQSLHKYLYAHANPINMIDPSGRFTMADVLASITIRKILRVIALGSTVVATVAITKTFTEGHPKQPVLVQAIPIAKQRIANNREEILKYAREH